MTSKSASRSKILKNVGISDLDNLELSIPPGLLPPGIMIVAVMTPSGTQVGYIEAGEMPVLRPLGDLSRLAGIQRMVGSSDAVDDRSRQGNIVKVVANRVSAAAVPNFGPGAPKAIADAVSLVKVLEENCKNLKNNNSRVDFAVAAKNYLMEQSNKVGAVLRNYITHQTTSGGVKKTLREFAVEEDLPFWVFSHLTTKGWVPSSPQDSIAGILFPKNTSKGIALKVSEWSVANILTPLEPFMRKCGLIKQIIENLDTILGNDAAERGARVQSTLESTYVPLVPPWSFVENIRAQRTANPAMNRDGDLSPLSAVIGRIFQTIVGNRPRALTARTFWPTMVGFAPDRASQEKASDQWLASEENHGLDTTLIDRLLLKKEVAAGDAKSLLFTILTGIGHDDPRLASFAGDGTDTAVANRQDGNVVHVPAALQLLFDNCTVATIEDRARKAVQLDLTAQEEALVSSEPWHLKTQVQKERRFPIGDAPTESAVQLLAAIKPHSSDPLMDRHFSGLYSTLTELLSSFNHPRVTNRAVQIIRATMTRLKGEGLFFSSDALTGVGGELITVKSDQGLFDDI